MAPEVVASTGHRGRWRESVPVLVTRRFRLPSSQLVLFTGSGQPFLHSSSLEGALLALKMRMQGGTVPSPRLLGQDRPVVVLPLSIPHLAYGCHRGYQSPEVPENRGWGWRLGDHVSPIQAFKALFPLWPILPVHMG